MDRTRRPWRAVLAAIGSMLAAGAAAGSSDAGLDVAPRVFLQIGVARDAHAAVVGVTRPWRWRRDYRGGALTGYWEASVGRWTTDLPAGASSSAWVTQVGVTPVLRWSPHGSEAWFVEAGIGVNLIAPLYRSRERRFSTAFNFGDHLALGRRFGEGHAHELALRLQHFSNAGIKRPNPGADFLQLRYARGW